MIRLANRLFSAAIVLLISVFAISQSVSAQQEKIPETEAIFSKYSESVYKVQVVEKDSGAKAVIGSGFLVSGDGLMITNYHVVSKHVLQPDRYRAEILDASGSPFVLQVLGVDIINDLAVVKAEMKDVKYLTLFPFDLNQGTRLYSLGFPLDIGLSIVEGTYNGLLKHALYRKIHFTAPINPGMSGGPAINAAGEVIGVNVSSAGEEVSFLVPAETVQKLLASTIGSSKTDQSEFVEAIRQQLLVHQDVFFTDNLMKSGQHVNIGGYRLPSQLTPSFKCWGDSKHADKLPYHTVNHYCSTDDYIYISGDHHSGIIRFSHQFVSSDELNRFRFYSLYSSFFKDGSPMYGSEEEVTRFKCRSGAVKQGQVSMKTAFCMRGYRKFKGLYDVVFKAATLGSPNSGVLTTLELSGVSFEKAVSLTKGYLEGITWGK